MELSLKDWKLIKKSLIVQVDHVNQAIQQIIDNPEQSEKLKQLQQEKKRLFELIEMIREEIDISV